MRAYSARLLIAAAFLPLAVPALAFDPDTPVGGEPVESFPLVLQDDASETIGLAFFTAFGVKPVIGAPQVVTREVDGRAYSFSPAALQLLDGNRAVLLSLGSDGDAGHSDGGVNAIHYLKSSPAGWVRDGEWFGLGSVGTVGNAATSWAFTRLLGKNPYLVTAGGGVWQGCMISTATVTELTADGPVDRGSFTDAMSSGASDWQKDAQYNGQIVAARKDASFTVGYSGTAHLRQNYVLRDGRYQLVSKNRIPGC